MGSPTEIARMKLGCKSGFKVLENKKCILESDPFENCQTECVQPKSPLNSQILGVLSDSMEEEENTIHLDPIQARLVALPSGSWHQTMNLLLLKCAQTLLIPRLA